MLNEYVFLPYNSSNMFDQAWLRSIIKWLEDNIGEQDKDWITVFSLTKIKFEFNTIEHKMLFALTWLPGG